MKNTTDTPSAYRDLTGFYGYHPVQAEQVIRTVLEALGDLDETKTPLAVATSLGVPSAICWTLHRYGDVR